MILAIINSLVTPEQHHAMRGQPKIIRLCSWAVWLIRFIRLVVAIGETNCPLMPHDMFLRVRERWYDCRTWYKQGQKWTVTIMLDVLVKGCSVQKYRTWPGMHADAQRTHWTECSTRCFLKYCSVCTYSLSYSYLLTFVQWLYSCAGYWPMGYVVCDVWQAMDVMLCTSSIWHMCTISIDRYIGIRYPLKAAAASRFSWHILIHQRKLLASCSLLRCVVDYNWYV